MDCSLSVFSFYKFFSCWFICRQIVINRLDVCWLFFGLRISNFKCSFSNLWYSIFDIRFWIWDFGFWILLGVGWHPLGAVFFWSRPNSDLNNNNDHVKCLMIAGVWLRRHKSIRQFVSQVATQDLLAACKIQMLYIRNK